MDDGPTRRQLLALLWVMCLALALVIGANSSLSVALPDLAADTGATQTQLTWVVNAYALTFAAILLFAGIAADRYGRRPALVLGLTVFGVASALSAFLDDPVLIIVLRAVAGLGAAAVFPATLSVLIDAFPADRRAFAVSVWAGVSGAGATAGTLIAGLLLEVAWWGSVQLVFGLGALALVPAVLAIVPDVRNPRLHLDPPGALLAALGLGGLVFGVIEGPERGWTDPVTLAGLGTGVLGLLLFVRHELRTADPLLDVRLFRNGGLSAGSLLVFLQFFAVFGFFVLAPQVLQFVRGYSPLEAALALLPLAAGVGPASALVPGLIARVGARVVGAGGAVVLAAAFALLALLAQDAPYWQLAVVLVLFGLGFGAAITPGTTLIVDGLPADRRTLASAVNDVTREVGAVLGGSVLASALLAVYREDVRTAVAELPPAAAGAAEDGIAGALAVAPQLGPEGAGLVGAAQGAFSSGYDTALLIGAGFLLLGALACAVLAPAGAGRVASPPAPAADAGDERRQPVLAGAP
jgi:EmrB/QacA subfamily drug resistance transporter